MKFHKPSFLRIVFDLLMLLFSFYVVLDWFPLTTNTPFNKYSLPSLFYFITGVIVSSFLGRYKPLKKQNYFDNIVRLFYSTFVVYLIFWILLHFIFTQYSANVLLTMSFGVFLVNYLLLSIYYAYRVAVDYNEIEVKPAEERVDAQIRSAHPIDNESYNLLCSTIRSYSGDKALQFLKQNLDLNSSGIFVYISTDAENLQMLPKYQYFSIVQLERLNNLRGINQKLKIINEKLPDQGIFVCCFESKSTRKKRILKRNRWGLNYIVYSFDYLFKRVMPKIIFTRNIYYMITGGKNRIFSKAEVLGRLYCFGFTILTEKKVGQLTYVVAQREKQPEKIQKRVYGPLIRLRRFGKDGQPFEVYKMRTMHPYSEYLQSYIYKKNKLKEGGKFKKDFRVTTIGTIIRKYWLDELPMLFNLFNGDMKVVGVRPLSAQYYNLYSKELQDKRNKFKPGLLPPFYADMPKTLEEIQASEMKYLTACEQKGIFVTDFRYLFLILKNILFKKARSA